MALPNYDTIYVPGSSIEILDQLITDYRLALIDKGITDPVVFKGTEPYIRFNAVANAALAIFANLEMQASQANELTASGDHLDDIREAIGLEEKAETPGTGTILPTILLGSVLFVDGLEFVSEDGLRGKVDGNQTIANGSELTVVMIDTGLKSNLLEDAVVRFVNPPVNVLTDATVVADFAGGYDSETDAEKRARILDRRRYPLGGGNWSQLKELAESTNSGVQAAVVYPALGGPGSSKVVVFKTLGTNNSRQLSSTIIDDITAAIESEFPSCFDIVAQSAIDQYVDVAIKLTIPDATKGNGWLSTNVFPTPTATYSTITSVLGTNEIRITSATTGAPTAGTVIAVWDSVNLEFIQASIVSFSSMGAGSWDLTLDIATTDMAAGMAVSPAAENMADYGESYVAKLNAMGPGENTALPGLLPRSYRQPLSADSYTYNLTSSMLTSIQTANTEIADLEYHYRTAEYPTVPASINTAPNIFVPRHFAIYKKV
jgi:uncharacterized phage protein gp47/JayE